MSMEYPYMAARWAKRTPDQLIPVKKELEVGKFFRIDSSFSTDGNQENIKPTRYHVRSQLAVGVLRASRVDDTTLPASIVLHRINHVDGATAEREEAQKFELLHAQRRVDLPVELKKFGAVVPMSYGYLGLSEEQQDGNKVSTGMYTLSEYFGSKNAEQTLEAIREQGNRVDPRLIAQIILNVGSTLAVAHHLGYVHRDVKPSNIQLRDLLPGSSYPADYAALTDWETAYQKGGTPTDFEWGIGTEDFMAPEQNLAQTATAAAHTNSQMDVYALGMTIYALLGGETPSSRDVMVQAGMGEIDPSQSPLDAAEVERVCKETGLPGLKDIILHATVVRTQERYQSVKTMLLDSVNAGVFSNNYEPNSLREYITKLPEPTI